MMAQRLAEQTPIAVVHPIKKAFQRVVELAVLFLMAQDAAAHHGRERERDKAGHQHRRCDGEREFREQFAGVAGGERQGQEYRDQGQGHGHHGKGDFFAAFQRRLHGFHAGLDMAVNVFQHHNRVVHHQADGQHQAEQGEDIDSEAKQVQENKRADQGHRNRDKRNQRGAERAQENKDHRNHQQHRFQHRFVHGLDRAFDE